MAIYSLSHKPIGKSTQRAPHTAAAHIAYITRSRALHQLEAARMPAQAEAAAAWLRSAEDRDRANARVVDKVMLALPRELSPEQRVALVRAFADEVTRGRASWLAAFHDNGTAGANPHCHLVIRDRDPDTGKRVAGMSEKGSTERLRLLWEHAANAALERQGRAERIDRRTLRAQGIGRAPTIHVGVGARRVARGRAPRSGRQWYRNGVGARRRQREVDYAAIDRGRSRAAHNQDLETARWAAIDADTQQRELGALRAVHLPPEAAPRNTYRDFWLNYQRGARPAQERGRDAEWEPDD